MSVEEAGHRFTDIKAIVFDFDGVILESGNLKTEAFVDLFADTPQHQPAVLQFHLDNLGVSRYTKFRYAYEELLQRPYTPEVEAALGRDFSALVLEKILRCPPVPGALDLLAELQQRQLPAFVASGTPQSELELIVRERDLDGFFTEVWGTPSEKPTILRDIMGRYGWQPQAVIMVGDGMSDYEAALATGTHFVARQTDEQSWDDIDVPRLPDMIRFNQLLPVARLAPEL